MKNETQVLAYIGLSKEQTQSLRGSDTAKEVVRHAKLVTVQTCSVVTKDNRIPVTLSGETDGWTITNVAPAFGEVDAGQIQAAQDEEGFKFETRAVPALCLIRGPEGFTLIEATKAQELKRGESMVAVVPVQNVEHISCVDSTVGRKFSLGYILGETVPEEFTVQGLQFGAFRGPARTPESDKTFMFESWIQVAIERRKAFVRQSEEDEKQRQFDAEEFTPKGIAREKAAAQRRERELIEHYLPTPPPEVEPIVLAFKDVEVFKRAAASWDDNYGVFPYRVGKNGYIIERNAETLEAIRMGREKLEAELSETAVKE